MNTEEYDLMYRVEDSHWWYAGMRAISGAVLAGDGVDGGTARILDAGCGTGRNAVELGRLGQVTGVDLSSRAIHLCTVRGLTRLARASVAQLPFGDETFDLVTSFDVLCHAAVRDEHATLREFWRVLRPEGRLLVHLPAYGWLKSRHDHAVQNERRYAAAEVRSLLDATRFTIVRMTYANTLLFPLAAVRRLAGRAPAAGDAASDLNTNFGRVGAVFAKILAMEAHLIRHVDLPFGLTLVVLAKKGCPRLPA
jgi:SAM-dependent methyltransferase